MVALDKLFIYNRLNLNKPPIDNHQKPREGLHLTLRIFMIIKFDHTRKVLTDNSEVFDVMLHVDEEMRVTVWNAPSETTADACTFALNSLLNEFQKCGSDFEALALMERVRKAL